MALIESWIHLRITVSGSFFPRKNSSWEDSRSARDLLRPAPLVHEIVELQASIRFNPEFDSNEIDESLEHDEKHDGQRTSTLRGISID
jgi:hypothetical protein